MKIGDGDNHFDLNNRHPSPAYSRERAGERVFLRCGKALSPTLSRRTGRGGKSGRLALFIPLGVNTEHGELP